MHRDYIRGSGFWRFFGDFRGRRYEKIAGFFRDIIRKIRDNSGKLRRKQRKNRLPRIRRVTVFSRSGSKCDIIIRVGRNDGAV